jgi:hypothetical protein
MMTAPGGSPFVFFAGEENCRIRPCSKIASRECPMLMALNKLPHGGQDTRPK